MGFQRLQRQVSHIASGAFLDAFEAPRKLVVGGPERTFGVHTEMTCIIDDGEQQVAYLFGSLDIV